MRDLVCKIGVLVVLALASSQSFAGEIVDRMIASVDNVPILQSDWDQAVSFEALQQGRTVASFTSEQRREVLEHLVDQQLLRSQMGDEHIATAEEREVTKQVEKIRTEYVKAGSDEDWQRLLHSYGIDDAWLREKVARQLQVMRFVDLRLLPETSVARADVENYYTNTLLPAVRSKGSTAENLADVYPRIEEILRQQRMDDLLNAWLHDLREHSDIKWLGVSAQVPAVSSAGASTSGGH